MELELSKLEVTLLHHCVTLEINRLNKLKSKTNNLKEFKEIYDEHMCELGKLESKLNRFNGEE